MNDLRPGMQIFHHGVPMELLYRKDKLGDMEIWRVKLLFVEPKEIDEFFEEDSLISFVHTNKVRGVA